MERPINMTAVRAANRLINAASTASSEAADADAGFDGGEWSRGWHADDLVQQIEGILERVGARFGVSGDELNSMVMADLYGRELIHRP